MKWPKTLKKVWSVLLFCVVTLITVTFFYPCHLLASQGIVNGAYNNWEYLDLSWIHDNFDTGVGEWKTPAWERAYAVDPSTEGRVYIWVQNILYRSDDSGSTWVAISRGANPKKMLIDSNGVIYILRTVLNGYYIAVYRSTDGGYNFEKIFPQGSEGQAATYGSDIALGYDNNLYVLFSSTGTRYESAIYRSLDRGEAWSKVADIGDMVPGQDYLKVKHLVVSRSASEKILVVWNTHLLYSGDNGESWKNINVGAHTIYDVQFDPTDDSTWYVTSYEHLYSGGDLKNIAITNDNGEHWNYGTLGNPGGSQQSFLPIRITKVAGRLYITGEYHGWSFIGGFRDVNAGVFVSEDQGETWQQIFAVPTTAGIYVFPIDMVQGVNNEGRPCLYILNDFYMHKLVRIDLNPGQDVYPHEIIGWDRGGQAPVILSKGTQVVVANGQSLIMTNDGFKTIKSTGMSVNLFLDTTWTGTGSDSINSLAQAGGNSNLFYIGMHAGAARDIDQNIYSFDVSSSEAVRLGLNLPNHDVDQGITTCVAPSPQDEDTIYANVSDTLYKTTDGGVHWQGINRGQYTVIKPDEPDVLFEIQNDSSNNRFMILRSEDGGATWTTVLEDATSEFKDIEISPQDPATIYALSKSKLYKSVDGGLSWEEINRPAIVGSALALDSLNPNVLVLAGHRSPRYDWTVYVSHNGGHSWLEIGRDLPLGTEQGFTPQAVTVVSYTPSNRIIYLASKYNDTFTKIGWFVMAEASSLRAQNLGESVVLSWQNPRDPFFKGVRIYGSTDGETFTLLADLPQGEASYEADFYPFFKVTVYDSEENESPGIILNAGEVQDFLSVEITGGGLVETTPEGISCPENCSSSFGEGTEVTLTATPDEGFAFTGWGGDCAECGTNNQCTITMDANKTCSAAFEEIPNEPPVIVSFSVDPTSGTAPLTVTVTCQATDPDGNIVAYEFDPGDGSVPLTSNDGTFSYTYNTPGSYEATCTAHDDEGASVTSEPVTVSVEEAGPTWTQIEGISYTRSRTLYDRINRAFFVLIDVTNDTGADIEGPVRMVLVDPTLDLKTDGPGLAPDGYTEDGEPYFIIVPEEGSLGAGETLEDLRLDFVLKRARLTFGLRFEALGTSMPGPQPM